MPTTGDILNALRTIQDPDLHRDIVSLGFIRNLHIDGGVIRFDINLTTPACPVKDQMKAQAVQAVSALPGVSEVHVEMTAEVKSAGDINKTAVDKVKNIVAIASGKGGVGKSTVAVNLAVAMAQEGARVGLLDADIYGPTVPLMMGPEAEIDLGPNKEILPAEAHGIKFMSMGFMAPGDQPLIWRGPMAHQALQQSLFQTSWGELDYLFVDLPPGTGDVHLTLVQSVRLAGGVLVSTPQDVGLTISLKTLRMFQTTNVRILGMVENMSYYLCSHCGERDEIFGHGGARASAEKLGVPFLGEIPLVQEIREFADKGRPIVIARPDAPVSLTYHAIVRQLAAQISIAGVSPSFSQTPA